MASRKPRAAPLEQLPPGLVESVEREVRRRGALPLKKLSATRLARNAEAELQERLICAGLERTGTKLRVPVEAQLRTLLRQVSPQPMAGLARRLAGVSQAEVKRVALDLVRRNEGRLVIVRGKDHVALPSDELLDTSQLGTLRVSLTAAMKLVSKAVAKRGQPSRTLLRAEVAVLLERVCSAIVDDPKQATREPEPARARQLVLSALDHLRRDDPLVYVPALVRSLAGQLTSEQVLVVLAQAACEALVELRPESGIRTLPREDAALCLPGPQGTVLSFVRRRAGEQP